MSCIAMSVGLGNVWRFPFTALENGGGAFLIPYLIVLAVVGRPIYYLEMIVGQFSSRGSAKVYDLCPAMRGKFKLFSKINFKHVRYSIRDLHIRIKEHTMEATTCEKWFEIFKISLLWFLFSYMAFLYVFASDLKLNIHWLLKFLNKSRRSFEFPIIHRIGSFFIKIMNPFLLKS